MRRFAITTTAAVIGLAGLTACGSSGKTPSAAGTGAPASASASGSGSTTAASGTDTIMIKDFMFMPMTDTVKVGTKVTWMNMDDTVHTVESSNKAFPASMNLKQGGTYSYTFTKAGTYAYICGVHNYMTATITVS